MSARSMALAARIEEGAAALAALAERLTDADWNTRMSVTDARPVGVIVHHVGNMYPAEVELAQLLAQNKPITVTWEVIAQINADHARAKAGVTRDEAIAFVRERSRVAAEAVRRFTDQELDGVAAVALNGNAPLTAQFFIEDHALRHSFHHLAKIKALLGRG